jgi:hypothetical protein
MAAPIVAERVASLATKSACQRHTALVFDKGDADTVEDTAAEAVLTDRSAEEDDSNLVRLLATTDVGESLKLTIS